MWKKIERQAEEMGKGRKKMGEMTFAGYNE